MGADGGVADQDVDLAESLYGCGKHAANLRLVRDVGNHRQGLDSQRGGFGGHGFGLFPVRPGVDYYICALGRQLQDDSSADVAPRAGDQSHPAFQSVHLLRLLMCPCFFIYACPERQPAGVGGRLAAPEFLPAGRPLWT